MEYAKDSDIGSYMYFFEHRNKRYCVDATAETKFKGRLINHSYLRLVILRQHSYIISPAFKTKPQIKSS